MPEAKLRSLFYAGLTYDEIAEANFRDEGWRPSRSGVKRKYEAMGMPPRRPSNKDTIPWSVRTEHNSHLFRHMLSAEARNRRGTPLSDTDRKLLNRMHELLFGRGMLMVIDYDPAYPDGFFLSVRRDDDTDIFRTPRNASLLRTDIQAALRDKDTSDRQLARMALDEGLRPEVLEGVGRNAAAEVLRSLIEESRKTPEVTVSARSNHEPSLEEVGARADQFVEAVRRKKGDSGASERGA